MTSYNFDLGKAVPVCKGEYSSEKQYEYLDWVTCDGSSWLCVNPEGTSSTPEDDSDEWFLVARGGDKGDSVTVKAGSGLTVTRSGDEFTVSEAVQLTEVTEDFDNCTDRFVTASAAACGVPASGEFSVIHVGNTELAIGSSDGSLWVRTKSNFEWGAWKEILREGDSSETAARLTTERKISLIGDVTGSVTTDLGADVTMSVDLGNFDASKLKSGVIDIDRIPPRAVEKVVNVANESERYALTTERVQDGDSVRETDTGKLYIVIDDTKLSSEDGYAAYNSQELPRGGLRGQILVSDGLGGGMWRWPGEVSLDAHIDEDHTGWYCVPSTLLKLDDKFFYRCPFDEYKGFYGPCVNSVGVKAFAETNLKAADLPVCRLINTDAFRSCPQLTKLWVPSVCTAIDAPYLANTVTVWTDSSALPENWTVGDAVVKLGKTHEEFLTE